MITVSDSRAQKRRDDVMKAIPSLLRTEVPEGMKDWPSTLILGLMLNAVERLSEPSDPAAVSRYIAGHMRMAFRPHGRKKLDALMQRHLTELAE